MLGCAGGGRGLRPLSCCGAQPIRVTSGALAVQGEVRKLCLPRISVAAMAPLGLVGLWDTKALEVCCSLHISIKFPLASHALQGQKESPGNAKALGTAETLKMLFVPLVGDGFGDFLVGLGILFTFPEVKQQRDIGRRTVTLFLHVHKELKPSPALARSP